METVAKVVAYGDLIHLTDRIDDGESEAARAFLFMPLIETFENLRAIERMVVACIADG